MTMTVLSFLAIWTLVSIPTGIIVGNLLAHSTETGVIFLEPMHYASVTNTSISKPDFNSVHASTCIPEYQI